MPFSPFSLFFRRHTPPALIIFAAYAIYFDVLLSPLIIASMLSFSCYAFADLFR